MSAPKIPLVSSLCADYIIFARVSEGKARTTLKQYQNRLRIFSRWLGEGATIESVTVPVLYDFLIHLDKLRQENGKPLTKTTIQNFFFPIRALGEWLVRTHRWPSNLAKQVRLPERSEPEQRLVADRTIDDMLSACGCLYPPRRAALATLTVRLLIYTGIRRSELLALLISDVDLRSNTITVRHGKGDKSRTLGLHPEVRTAYQSWMTLREPCRTRILLTIQPQRQMGDQGLRDLLRSVEAAAGHAGERITCHPMRHNYATYNHYEAGMPVMVLKDSMGHSRLSTTQVYFDKKPKAVIDQMRMLPVRGHQAPAAAPRVRRSIRL